MGDDNKSYYLAPRAFTFVDVALKNGFVLPSGVQTFATPAWFNQSLWPFHKPWGANPNPSGSPFQS